MNIIDELLKINDLEYVSFQSKLIPNINPDTIIGVKTPELKRIAKELYKNNDYENFLNSLPHKYFEENIIHGLLISEFKDYNLCINYIDKFLPYIDNWAVCDQTNPKVFKKHKEEVLIKINEWINSNEIYKIRFGVKTLMSHFLDDDFNKDYLKLPLIIKNDDYYVKMMIAWYYATALAKQYDEAIKIIESNELDIFIHNKTIQKAIESFRVTDEHKKYLRTLKR
jgi:3-methyladenine DNA glycosylase AlkD